MTELQKAREALEFIQGFLDMDYMPDSKRKTINDKLSIIRKELENEDD